MYNLIRPVSVYAHATETLARGPYLTARRAMHIARAKAARTLPAVGTRPKRNEATPLSRVPTEDILARSVRVNGNARGERFESGMGTRRVLFSRCAVSRAAPASREKMRAD